MKKATQFDAAKAVKLYKKGTPVVDIAVTMGYERGQGQNRVRAALVAAGVYTQKRAATSAPAKKQTGKLMAMPVPTGPEMALAECYKFVESRYKKLVGRQRTGWVEKLTGLLLAGIGATTTQKIQPVALLNGLQSFRGKTAAA